MVLTGSYRGRPTPASDEADMEYLWLLALLIIVAVAAPRKWG